MPEHLANELTQLATEGRNPESENIDQISTNEILRIINNEDAQVAHAVALELPYVAEAVDLLVESFRKGGRLFYVGAGTSGRLGVIDAAECPPTFGTSPDVIRGLIAGGHEALWHAQEGAEDQSDGAIAELKFHAIGRNDVVCGIAASRRTPYVIGALQYAQSVDARTIIVTCNPRSKLTLDVDVAICPVVGPEVIAGSTRMKAGTATKLVLNMLSTASMIKLGKTYGNLMIDLKLTSRKLKERAHTMLMLVTDLTYDEASNMLERADGHVKTAIVMSLSGLTKQQAQERLAACDGKVRQALQDTKITESF